MFDKTLKPTLIILNCFVLFGCQMGNDATPSPETQDSTSPPSNTDEITSVIEIFRREYYRKHLVTVLDYELEKELIKGEGSYFTSGIVRLNFTYKNGAAGKARGSVLLKIPQMGIIYSYAKKMLFYRKEKYMYEDVIPRMYNNTPFENPSPNFYGSSESGILVLENLQESGYQTKAKGTLFDLASAKMVLKSLAQFHALSTKHLSEISQQVDFLTVSDRGDGEWATKIFPPIIRKLKKHLLPRYSESTNEKFDKFVDNVRWVIKLGYHHSERFNVILHGDARVSNMLFQFDKENNMRKCKFIDYQSSRRGSPIVDVMFFLITSVKFEVFENHRDEIYYYYAREFENTLEKSTTDGRPSFEYGVEQLKADFELHKSYFLYVLTGNVPVFWAGDSKTDSKEGEENAMDVMLKSEKYSSTFDGWMKYLL